MSATVPNKSTTTDPRCWSILLLVFASIADRKLYDSKFSLKLVVYGFFFAELVLHFMNPFFFTCRINDYNFIKYLIRTNFRNGMLHALKLSLFPLKIKKKIQLHAIFYYYLPNNLQTSARIVSGKEYV